MPNQQTRIESNEIELLAQTGTERPVGGGWTLAADW